MIDRVNHFYVFFETTGSQLQMLKLMYNELPALNLTTFTFDLSA